MSFDFFKKSAEQIEKEIEEAIKEIDRLCLSAPTIEIIKPKTYPQTPVIKIKKNFGLTDKEPAFTYHTKEGHERYRLWFKQEKNTWEFLEKEKNREKLLKENIRGVNYDI